MRASESGRMIGVDILMSLSLSFFIKGAMINTYTFQCVSEPPRGRVSAELSKPVERKGAMCVVLV